jgi:isoleucyl-tRNA synthetase
MVLPGIHHVMARAIKDILQIQNSKGYQVKMLVGIPMVYPELGTEKEPGITKEDINKDLSKNITKL